MKFIYQARDASGQSQKGEVRAMDRLGAEKLLSEAGLVIISLTPSKDDFLEEILSFGQGVSSKDLVLFSRQLSTLVGAQMPIVRALRILEGQIESRRFASVVRELALSVENGESLSGALAKKQDIFGGIYVSLVKSGELSGTLNKSLLYLADQLEKDYQLKSKVRSALTYPAFVIVTLVVVGLLMFKFVLPKLTSILIEQGGELPLVSRIIISMTGFVDQFWWLILALMAIAVVAVRMLIKTPVGRSILDALKIRLPILKSIFAKLYLARFARNLSTLIAGGIPIIQAIQSISDIVGNVHYRAALQATASAVAGGKSVSESLSFHEEFPPIVSQMVRVGEEAGQLDDILDKLARFYEKDLEEQVTSLTSLLEPVIMIVLGLGVGALVAGVLLPIYNLASSIG
jgi:type IV pilus assembly protein PilC